MSVFNRKEPLSLIAAVLLSVLLVGGCATAIKYSYDTRTRFSEQKSYTWALPSATQRKDPLLESNVEALTDQLLAQKGLTRVSGKSDLIISMSYEFESILYHDSYQLRMLTLNVSSVNHDMPAPSDTAKMPMQKEDTLERKQLVWRGTAFGTIYIDAASGGLTQAVQGILSNFPPH